VTSNKELNELRKEEDPLKFRPNPEMFVSKTAPEVAVCCIFSLLVITFFLGCYFCIDSSLGFFYCLYYSPGCYRYVFIIFGSYQHNISK
jgi:hypothetical protein